MEGLHSRVYIVTQLRQLDCKDLRACNKKSLAALPSGQNCAVATHKSLAAKRYKMQQLADFEPLPPGLAGHSTRFPL